MQEPMEICAHVTAIAIVIVLVIQFHSFQDQLSVLESMDMFGLDVIDIHQVLRKIKYKL